MVLELIVVAVAVWVIFGDYIAARAHLIEEAAREKELENDRKELEDEY